MYPVERELHPRQEKGHGHWQVALPFLQNMPTAQRNREAGPEEGPEEAGEAGPEEGPGYHRSWRSRARRSGTASVRGILTLAGLLARAAGRAEFGGLLRGTASLRGILRLVVPRPAGRLSRQMLRSKR